jgi:hypothetical protein
VDKSSLLNCRIWPGTVVVAAAHRVARSAKEEWAEEEEVDHSVEEVVETHTVVVEEYPGVHTVAEEEEDDQAEEEEDHLAEEEEEVDHSVEEVVETHTVVVEEYPGVHTVAEEEEVDHLAEEEEDHLAEEEEDHLVEEEVVHMVGEQVVQEFHDRHMAVEIEGQQKSDQDQFTMAEARSAT